MSVRAGSQPAPPIQERGTRVLGGHSLIYAVSSLMGQLGSLLTFPLYTRALGVTAYGVLALVLSATGVLRTLVIAGTNTALMHERISASEEDVPSITGAAFLYVLFASVVLAVLAAVTFPWLAARGELDGQGALVAAGIALVAVDALYELVLAVARAESRPADYAYSNAIRVGVTLVGAGGLLLMTDAGPMGAVAGMAAGSVCAGVWLAARLRLRGSLAGVARWVPRLLRQGGPLVPANLASWVSNVSDRYLLLWLLGSATAVGLYSAGYRLGALVTTLFVGPFHTAFLPLMLRQVGSAEGDASYSESSRLFLAFGSVAVCGLAATAVPGVRLLAGASFAGAERVVGSVALGCLLSGATMLMTPSALKVGRSYHLAMAYGAGAVSNVGLNLMLIPAFGIVGAAASTLAGYAITLGTMLVLMTRESRPPGVAAVLARVVPIMTLAMVPTMFAFGTPVRQWLVSVTLAVAAVAGLRWTGVLRRDDLTLAVRSFASLGTSAADKLLPRSTRAGRTVRRVARAFRRMPRALREIAAVWARRRRRAREAVCGDPGTGPYLTYLSQHPEALSRATDGVDRIVGGEMLTFSHPWQWTSSRDWHLDPISGRRWLLLPSMAIDVNFVVRDSDVQCVWETSRLEHVWRVALEYVRSGDESCARWAVDMLRSWERSNPVGWGVNWTVAMEVGLRAIAIAEMRVALRGSPIWDEHVDRRVCRMLADHAEWVLAHLEHRGARTQNHYLVALVGVISVAMSLPEWTRFRDETSWVYGALFDSIEDQVLADGVSFENSLGYHLLVAEVIGYAVAACRALDVAVPEQVVDRLGKMIGFAHLMQFGDGSPVDVGDDDDDFVLPSALPHFELAKPLTGHRLEYAAIAAEAAGTGTSAPGIPAAFADSGLYVLGEQRMRAFLNAMPTGVRGSGPHRHNDALSFCLEVGSRPVLVDRGTFRYQTEGDGRLRYRSVAAHSTVQVDGAEQNDLTATFALPEDRIAISDVEVSLGGPTQRVAATHSGFAQVSGVFHRRTWEYALGSGSLRVVDTFSAGTTDPGRHDFIARFHLAAGLRPDAPASRDDSRFEICCGPCSMSFELTAASSASVRVVDALHSPRYHVEESGFTVEVLWTGDVHSILVTTMTSRDANA